MPLIDIHPNSDAIENELTGMMGIIRPKIKSAVIEITKLPEHDIIVTLHKCTVRDADPCGSSIIVFLDTNPNEDLEFVANVLRDTVANVFIELGLTENSNVEIWPRFLPGSWCLVNDGKIIDTVDHNKI